jgi:hypothetical protein
LLDRFAAQGYVAIDAVLSEAACHALLDSLPPAANGAGNRSMLAHGWCAQLAQTLRSSAALAGLVPPDHVALQCTLFEKSADTNWLVPIHQDLSIPVAEQVGSAPLQGWSQKQGNWFVQPPLAVLQQLVALRLHLDDCGSADGPLYVVPGSHLNGLVPQQEAIAARGDELPCTLGRGGVLAMRPLLLHRSSKATGDSRRRVLHFVFGPAQLPHGLRWSEPG